jgi:three-Cys-motif partner protein
MASEHRRNFFAGVKEHSQIKLRAFERYLPPWTGKVGSSRGVKRLWIVDGFAGAGQYDSGEFGSSGIALSHAAATNAADRGYKVACYFVEASAVPYQRLTQLCSQFPTVEVIPTKNNFWTQINNVADFVGDSPAFVFVDPFGLGDLKFDSLARLCQALPRLDLMVNFASPAARRLKPAHPALISESVGGAGWELETLTQTFADRLRAAGGFLKPAVLPVQDELGGLRYEMVMAARHSAAYELWNDEIARDESLLLKEGAPEAIAAKVRECTEFIRLQLLDRRSFQRDRLIADLSVTYCGEYHRSTYIRAVNELLKTDWLKAGGPIATTPIRRAP